ncbi:hypothetical protein [Methylibium petroleiphilum]|uniref:Uncharacterized protein n=1 Tax=Methylibium petroleiphilum (strain ATCC BAA-1232 / LMG 22953 / PM1) TaxID=420662 RepID=A2SPA2_METPP|nr:hypothetical protein [Methylibium petroleiphilum]ABM97391.1 hypothetical protein Mpe_B0627 [Methylibium petroleiphilum PM1]
MPPPEQALNQAIFDVANVKLQSFTASDTAILPANNVTLSWQVADVAAGVQILLNTISVSMSGQRSVAPLFTTTYSLTAAKLGISRQLASLTINVDHSACFQQSIPGDLISEIIISNFRTTFGGNGLNIVLNNLPNIRVTQKRDALVDIDANGIHLDASMHLAINNAPDASLGVKITFIVGVNNGKATATAKAINADVDFPWWVEWSGGLLGFALTEVVEAIIENIAEDEIRDRVKADIQSQLDAINAFVPDTCALISARTVENAIVATVCPKSEDTPCSATLPQLAISTLKVRKTGLPNASVGSARKRRK